MDLTEKEKHAQTIENLHAQLAEKSKELKTEYARVWEAYKNHSQEIGFKVEGLLLSLKASVGHARLQAKGEELRQPAQAADMKTVGREGGTVRSTTIAALQPHAPLP